MSKCRAQMGGPGFYTYKCNRPTTKSIGGVELCGIHHRMATKWESQGRLAGMMWFWWGIGEVVK